MVDPSKLVDWLAGARSRVLPETLVGVFMILIMIGVGPAKAQAPDLPTSGADARQPDRHRVMRLQDSLEGRGDWDIGMPVFEPESSFSASVRDGRALNSQAYLALGRELRQVRALIESGPADEEAQRRLADLRRALIERIEININLDYLYAAAVYLELLRQAEGPPAAVRRLSQRLSERRSGLGE